MTKVSAMTTLVAKPGRFAELHLAADEMAAPAKAGRVTYGALVSEHFATIWEAVADTFGDQPALIHGATVRTWSEFDDRAARLASAFLDAGVQPGDTVAIDLYNCSEYLEVFFAALEDSGGAGQRQLPVSRRGDARPAASRPRHACWCTTRASPTGSASLCRDCDLRLVVEVDETTRCDRRPAGRRRPRLRGADRRIRAGAPGSTGPAAMSSCPSPAGRPDCPRASSTSSTAR